MDLRFNQCGCGSCGTCGHNPCTCNYNHQVNRHNCNCNNGCVKYVSSDCVTMAAQYTCLGVAVGDTLTSAFEKVEALCDNQPSGGSQLVYYGAGGGDFPLVSTDWTTGPTSYTDNLKYVATQTSLYKITIVYSISSMDPNSRCEIGVGINSSDPTGSIWDQNFIQSSAVSGGSGSTKATIIYFVQLTLGQTVKALFKISSGLVEFDPIQMIVERVTLV